MTDREVAILALICAVMALSFTLQIILDRELEALQTDAMIWRLRDALDRSRRAAPYTESEYAKEARDVGEGGEPRA